LYYHQKVNGVKKENKQKPKKQRNTHKFKKANKQKTEIKTKPPQNF